MAVGRFDTPAQAQFMQTYSPIPFQEILQAGLAKQERQDVRLAQIDAAQQAAEQLKYIPTTEDERYIKGTVMPTIQEIADEFSVGRDLTDPNTFRQLRQRLNSLDRRRIADIQSSEEAWRKAEDIKAQMLAKGQTPFQPFDYTDYDTSVSGVYSQTPRATLDYEAGLQEFFSNVGEKYLGDRQTTEGRMGSFHGRTLNRLQQYAEDNVDIAAQDPRIQQLMEARGLAPTRENVLNTLLSEAPRFETSRLTGSYQDPNYRGSDSDTPFGGAGIPIPLRTQPTEFTNKSFKDVQKNVEAYQTERANLQSQLDIARGNNQLAVASQIENQIQKLDDDNATSKYWVDETNARVKGQFQRVLADNIGEFKQSISSFITDPEAVSKWTEAYNSAVSKNMDVERFDRVNLGAEVNKEYIELFGQDDDYLKWNQARGYKQGPITKAVNKGFRSARKIEDKLKSVRDQEWEAIRSEGIIEETIALPIVENSTDYKNFPEWREFNNAIQALPEDFKIDIVSSDELSAKDKAEYIDQLRTAEEINLISASEADVDSPYIYVSTTVKDKKGNNTRSEVGYKIRVSEPGQTQAIANTFLRKGDMYNAVKWMDPSISQSIEKEFKSGKVPQKFTINAAGTDIPFELKSDGWYITDEAGNTLNEVPYTSKEDIKTAAYNIFAKKAGIVSSN